jgi:hypothetical protein
MSPPNPIITGIFGLNLPVCTIAKFAQRFFLGRHFEENALARQGGFVGVYKPLGRRVSRNAFQISFCPIRAYAVNRSLTLIVPNRREQVENSRRRMPAQERDQSNEINGLTLTGP